MPHIDAFDTEYAPPQILGLSQLANWVAGWWDINNPPPPQEIVDAAKLAQRAQAAYLGASMTFLRLRHPQPRSLKMDELIARVEARLADTEKPPLEPQVELDLRALVLAVKAARKALGQDTGGEWRDPTDTQPPGMKKP